MTQDVKLKKNIERLAAEVCEAQTAMLRSWRSEGRTSVWLPYRQVSDTISGFFSILFLIDRFAWTLAEQVLNRNEVSQRSVRT